MNETDMIKTKKLYIATAMMLGLGLMALVLFALPTFAATPVTDERGNTRSVAVLPQSTTGEIHLKPDRVLVGSGVQMRDDYVISVEEDAGAAIITVTLDTVPAVTATVDYATNDGTATAGDDYVAVSGTLTFDIEMTELTFTIPIIDDTLDETDETVIVILSNPVNGTLVTPEFITLTIVDDDDRYDVCLPLVMKNWTYTPMIHISGRVTLENGTGLANVGIYHGVTHLSVCTGSLVTTTDENGYYQVDIKCPVGQDETLRVCPLLEGYTFVPEVDHWRTYGQCPDKETDFIGYPVYSPAR